MLILLSPAKNMNFEPAANSPTATKPDFLKQARALGDVAKELSPAQLKKLMGISDKLADLNHQRFQSFQGNGKSNAQKQAALAFNGDVYLGLDAGTLSSDDLEFAQDHLRILSGLYGVLRPLDAIEPYRLEMGSRLKNPAGPNLYAYWGDAIAKALNTSAKSHRDPTIVNLASKEYFGAVNPAALKGPLITPNFKEEKDGQLRQLQFFAKRARGLMARWAIENRVEKASDLKSFNVDGYTFNKAQSTDDQWLFTRPQPAPVAQTRAAQSAAAKPNRRQSASA